jgi:hypothetical protein
MNAFATTVTIAMVVTITLGLAIVASPIPELLGQGNDTAVSNQSSSANNTGWSNQTNSEEASGNISLFARPI